MAVVAGVSPARARGTRASTDQINRRALSVSEALVARDARGHGRDDGGAGGLHRPHVAVAGGALHVGGEVGGVVD